MLSNASVLALDRNANDLIPQKKVAEERDCSVKKLEWERANGRGPAYVRDGRKIFYRRRDLDVYYTANLHGGVATEPPRRGRPRKSAAAPASGAEATTP